MGTTLAEGGKRFFTQFLRPRGELLHFYDIRALIFYADTNQ